MKILVINAGSTTTKYKLFDGESVLLNGIFEKIGEDDFRHKNYLNNQSYKIEESEFNNCLSEIKGLLNFDLDSLDAIGFRVVHGGEYFTQTTLIDDDVLNKLHIVSELAPLHNPPAVSKIIESLSLFPNIPQYAVFDTEFHSTLPEKAYLYGIPYILYKEYKIRKYGFHGISHEYLSIEANHLLSNSFNGKSKRSKNSNIITCHLGGGSSICAVKDGKSIDTSMGFTPLEGLVMATRSGDIDDGVQDYLEKKLGYSEEQIYNMFNKESGLLGLSEYTSDMRVLLTDYNNDQRAKRAISVFIYRIQKYIGSYIATLGGLDALVFSGGIGSGSDIVRSMICERLEPLGISVDTSINQGRINVSENLEIGSGKVRIFVIPTNEELMIVRKISKVITF